LPDASAIRFTQSRRWQKAAAISQAEDSVMRLFMFKSEGSGGLQAFAPDSAGEQLPSRHGPWTAVGVVREDKNPPHGMSRSVIEKSITDQGFQLYKVKKPADR
jgi:hypothetical protein